MTKIEVLFILIFLGIVVFTLSVMIFFYLLLLIPLFLLFLIYFKWKRKRMHRKALKSYLDYENGLYNIQKQEKEGIPPQSNNH